MFYFYLLGFLEAQLECSNYKVHDSIGNLRSEFVQRLLIKVLFHNFQKASKPLTQLFEEVPNDHMKHGRLSLLD